MASGSKRDGSNARTSGIVNDQALDSIVNELNDVFRAGTMEMHLTMGRIIVMRLYNGNANAWRSRGPKEMSFQKLATRADRDLLVSATSLYRAVALFELTERLGISSWKHLGVSHLRAVLGLSDQDQRRLLASAERERWAVERLGSEVAKLRNEGNGRRGRRPLPAFVKSLQLINGVMSAPEKNFAGLDHITKLSNDEILRLQQIVTKAKEQLAIVDSRLQVRNTEHGSLKVS